MSRIVIVILIYRSIFFYELRFLKKCPNMKQRSSYEHVLFYWSQCFSNTIRNSRSVFKFYSEYDDVEQQKNYLVKRNRE
jgi:hypothetical protein